VNFRYATRSRAVELGLTGWVRNLPDGSVEAVFDGQERHLHEILAWCQKGPPSARVQDVETTWEKVEGPLRGFSVRG
jgi:acylphosphatase